MKTFGFEVAHGYEIWKGFVTADNEKEAEKKILNEEWDDIIDEFDIDDFVEGFEIVDIWS